MFTGQQRGDLEPVELGLEALESGYDVGGRGGVRLLLGELVEDLQVLELLLELGEPVELRLQTRQLGGDVARVLDVIPEILGGGLLAELAQPLLLARDVKGTPSRVRDGS